MTSTRVRRWRLWTLGALVQVLAALAMPRPGLATSVLLVRPTNLDAITSEALVRVQGELQSTGFSIQFASADSTDELDNMLGTVARDRGVDAVLAILGNQAPESIVVWVDDVATGRTLRRQTSYSLEGERSAEVLAIRAIEFLRACLLEVRLGAGEVPPQPPVVRSPPPVVKRATEPPPAVFPQHWGFEVGGSTMSSFDGVGSALLPLVRVDRALASWAVVRLTLAGLGSRARADGSGQSADITQQLAVLGAAFRLRQGHHLRPMLAIGAGVLHTTAEGRALWPYLGQNAEQWSLLADVGAGAWLKIGGRYDVAVELHGVFAQPYPVIAFVGSPSAGLGRPSLLVTLTLIGWL